MKREPNTQYVLSLSYGKDSIATIEACKRLGYPIDRIIHAEVWATDDISADLPPMVEFKSKADAIIKERYGLEVEHVCAMRKDGTKQTYEKMFYHVPKRRPKNTEYVGIVNGYPQTVGGGIMVQEVESQHDSRERESGLLKEFRSDSQQSQSNAQALSRQTFSQGMPTGFPVIGVPWCNKSLKVDSLRFPQRIPSGKEKGKPNNMVCRSQTDSLFRFAHEQGAKINTVQYLGIAADEPERIERHTKNGIVLPLVDIGWTEANCRKWCEENDLLSPIYTTSARGGVLVLSQSRHRANAIAPKELPSTMGIAS